MNMCKLRQELVRDEGLRLFAYQDTVGLWTIGVGHLLGSKRMLELTPSEVTALLESDIEVARGVARRLVPGLELVGDVRGRALVNMAFNLGGRLGQFTQFLAAVNTGNWTRAGEAMMQSKWATQVGVRAARLRDMILTGD